jgi:hypothetical protein
VHDDGVRSDDTSRSNDDIAEHLSPCTDHDPVLERRMPFAASPRLSAKCDPVIEHHVVADHGCLTDNDSHAMVDEEPSADARTRVNLDTG